MGLAIRRMLQQRHVEDARPLVEGNQLTDFVGALRRMRAVPVTDGRAAVGSRWPGRCPMLSICQSVATATLPAAMKPLKAVNTGRLLDLSVTPNNNPYTDPPPLLPKIDYINHQQQGWPEIDAMFPVLRKEDLRGNDSWAE